MPYIPQERRNYEPCNAGELNYHLFKVILRYLRMRGKCYATFNEIIGVLNCIQMELYRRWIAEYEDKKLLENGDITEDVE